MFGVVFVPQAGYVAENVQRVPLTDEAVATLLLIFGGLVVAYIIAIIGMNLHGINIMSKWGKK